MGRRENEILRMRNEGLAIAYKIVKAEGIEGLEREIRLRGATQINTHMTATEMDRVTEQMKKTMSQMTEVAFIAILHDTFGFGQKRCQKAIEAFEKLVAYLDHGWAYWADLIEELKTDLKLNMDTSNINGEHVGKVYAHPDPEDIYTEVDLVDESLWKEMLRALDFKAEDGKIIDHDGYVICEYDNQYDKIATYDFLSGIRTAIERWGPDGKV